MIVDRNLTAEIRNAQVLVGTTEVPVEEDKDRSGEVTEEPPLSDSCSVSSSTRVLHFDRNGGTILLDVEAHATCRWVLSDLPDWLQFDRSSGQGNATLAATAASASDMLPRSQLFAINDLSVAALQDGTAEAVLFNTSGGVDPDPSLQFTSGSLDCEFKIDTRSRTNQKWIILYLFLDGKPIGSAQNIGSRFTLHLVRPVTAAPNARVAVCRAVEGPFLLPVWEQSLVVPGSQSMTQAVLFTPGTSSAPTTLSCEGRAETASGVASVTVRLATPADENLLPACSSPAPSGTARARATLTLDGFTRPGTYTCTADAVGSEGTTLTDSATVRVTNPTCDCVPPDLNMARILAVRAGDIGFFVDIADNARALRVDSWLTQASAWWNNALAGVGSPSRITAGTIPIRIAPLPDPAFFQWNGGTNPSIEVDPRAFTSGYTEPFLVTTMAHELGHALGVRNHSLCDESQSIMVARLTPARGGSSGLMDAERCFVSSEFRVTNYTPNCQ